MNNRKIIRKGEKALRYLAAGAIALSLVLVSCGGDNGYGGGGMVFLVSVSVTPVDPNVVIGGGPNQQFTASGTYSNYITQNITTLTTWSSSDTNVATISNMSGSQGLAMCINPGPATITATFGYLSGMTTLTCS